MQYVKECLQLLYWIYFKPYTLKQHVQEICPEITNPYFGNYYRRSAEARANAHLKRYDDQCWWLTAIVPIPAVFWSGFTAAIEGYFFDWLTCLALPLSGWLIGQLSARAVRGKISICLLIAIATTFLFTLASVLIQYDHDILKKYIDDYRILTSLAFFEILGLMSGFVFGVLFGPLLGMASGAAFGIAFEALFGIDISISLGVVFGVSFGLALYASESLSENNVWLSLYQGGAIGTVFSYAFSTAFGMAFGTAFFISFFFGMLRLYFWLPELLWTLCLKLAPVPPVRCLRFLPPQFDQLIILPLPFLPGIIAAAYAENRADARQTINYLISSTNQQKTASKAMLLIAAEEFRCCRKASDIAKVQEQLDWLPAELAGQITACLELSHDTAAALEASTPFRQEERLKQVCTAIEQRRNALASASAREATTLGAVLDQWQGILATACRTLHETALRSGELPQVYLAGPPLEPDKAGKLFKGRNDLFRQIESLLLAAQPPTLVMHGGRRSGKSSSLRYLPQQLPSDILPLFVDCQGVAVSSTLAGFAERVADQLISSARSTHRLHLSPPSKEELARDPFAALLAWLDTVEQAAPGKTFLLCLDEFERIEEIVAATGSRAPLNFLRHLIQHRRRWLLLFAGARTPEELSPHWSDCLINTRSLRVSCLDKADAMDLLCRPVPDFPAIWPDAAAELVWQLTQGQPYLIQLLGQEAVEHLNRKKAKTMLPGDVEAILPTVFERGHYYFDEFWQALNEDQWEVLTALAKGKKVPKEQHTAAAGLLRKEVLTQESGRYALKVPLLGRWVVAFSPLR